MLRDAVLLEGVAVSRVRFYPIQKFGSNLVQVVLDGGLCLGAGDDHAMEVFIENIPHNLDQQVRLTVQQRRTRLDFGLAANFSPLRGETLNVDGELFLGCALGSRAHDNADILRKNFLQDALQPGTLSVGQLTADAVHRSVGNVHKVATGE